MRPPKEFTDAEKAAFRRIVGYLRKMQMLHQADSLAIEACAVGYVEWVELRSFIRENGRTYETVTETGSVMLRRRPEVPLLDLADKRLRAWLLQFGLSPASRAGLEPMGEEEDDPLAGLVD